MVLPGGTSDPKDATPEVQHIAESVKPSLLTKLSAEKHSKLHPFKAVSYKTQVVAGTNYFIKVAIDDGKEFIHLRVHKPLGESASPVLSKHQESHTQSSDLLSLGTYIHICTYTLGIHKSKPL
jgi:cystatin-A/B